MNDFSDWEVIDTYSTKQAVEDGFLVLVDSKVSKEAGIKYPVYLTRSVWDKYVEVPDVPYAGQSIDGRLWDVLYMFMFAARGCNSSTMIYKLNVVLADKGDWEPNERLDPDLDGNREMRLVTLKSVIQARDFDDPSPAIFIMKPSED
ncbi:MAG TPA: hypothetical protein DHV48_01130 [Prolixibacteraceae bacterium]|nr:hypothetical protein [Prolixibacteraceae bacterium]